jgi:hypothetical protein
MPDHSHLALVVMLSLGLAACATSGATPLGRSGSARMEGAMTRPLRDMGIMRRAIPDVLADATVTPYGLQGPVNCGDVAAEIDRLDTALGPDLDAEHVEPGGAAGEMLFDAFQGALDIPFRGLVRRVSGAESRDRARAAAVLAGMVRRAWLKGVAYNAACVAPAPTP